MFGQKTKGKGESRSSWKWLMALLMGLAAVFIAAWRVMVKRARRKWEETQAVASEPAAEERKSAESAPPKSVAEEEKASPAVNETASSEAETEPPSG